MPCLCSDKDANDLYVDHAQVLVSVAAGEGVLSNAVVRRRRTTGEEEADHAFLHERDPSRGKRVYGCCQNSGLINDASFVLMWLAQCTSTRGLCPPIPWGW
jgi:hypothetical protein